MDNLCFYLKIFWNIPKVISILKMVNKKIINVGLILAGGTGSRFDATVMKQLYVYNNEHLITHSINILNENVEHIIIVTNSKCFDEINKIIQKMDFKKTKIHVVINDINCRLDSIETGLMYIKNNLNDINNIIIHDSARPFVPKQYISDILVNTKYYSQYCLRLTNGLMDLNFNTLDRDKYIELCTPICMNFDLCFFIFINFISKKSRYTCEFIDILKIYKIEINIIYGKYKFIKKVTYSEDLE
jgi:2-C-methyl-D-erythritol 4-phosphate cytidylyltransferase